MKQISAAEANRQFSALMRTVAAGETVIVTSHGRPVVKMVPASGDDNSTGRAAAMARFIAHARTLPRQPALSWTREELYEDEPYPDTFK